MTRWIAVLSLLVAACASDSVVDVGIVSHFGESSGVIDAPATVGVGERFTVTVSTYGDGCTSAEWMAVDSDDASVELVPYDRQELGVCTLQLVRPAHSAEIEFSTSGTRSVVVRGRAVDHQRDAMIEVTHDLTVE